MGAVEDDVSTMTDAFLAELFGDDGIEREKKLAVARWLSSHVQQERQGWKKKIQMAFKEVEKERKLALDVHARIHSINHKFEPYLYQLYMFREASMHYPSDKDLKVSHIDQLEKNLNALLDMISYYQTERIQAFQYLKIADNSANLTEILSKRITRLEDQIKRVSSDSKETEARLEKEIKNLQETLDMKLQFTNEEKERHEKKVQEMRKMIVDLRAKCREMSQLSVPSGISPSPSSMVSNRSPATPPLSFRKSVSNISKELAGIDVSTQTFRPTRDCCIQVSVGSADTLKNGLKSPSKETLAKLSQSQEKRNIAQDIDIMDLKPLPPPGTTTYPITSITIVKRKGDQRSLDDVIEANNAVIKKFASNSLTSLSEAGQSNASRFDTAITGNARTVEFLRGQVTHLVSSLEQTKSRLENSKQEAEKYRHELATLRARTIQRENFYRSYNDALQTHRSLNEASPSEGKLTGVRVHESPRFAYTQQNGHKTKTSKPNFFQGMSKCLRCNKIYKLSENNQHACRYHPKARKQIEKYDTQGRLVRVSHQWQCCQQAGDATGCRTGEHV